MASELCKTQVGVLICPSIGCLVCRTVRGRDGYWKLSIALLFLGCLIADAFLKTNGEVLVLETPFITTMATINQFQK